MGTCVMLGVHINKDDVYNLGCRPGCRPNHRPRVYGVMVLVLLLLFVSLIKVYFEIRQSARDMGT